MTPAFMLSPGVLVQEQDGEAFLLEVASGQYFSLNHTGLLVWRALAEGGDPEAAVAAQYPDVAAAVRQRDVARILEDMATAGLVRRGG
jgi:hypothetical protein